ncbi:hypothetical protein N7510_009714 [Penicillium lagena]|uniref:uncharacterized protein n=1 Tax=Penicillium lagena TaxID=94218 RepID=UPI00253F9D1B|nr:uncharacterized protein N7510_009714 [Penicillium lagena]KAJ5604560.1 hypothetical protein N7510_009714 [Penicillium lagena]
MDAVSAASSIITVIEIGAKVASLLLQYYTAVKNAQSEIIRLQEELGRLNTTLEGSRKLLDSQNGKKLHTSQRLHEGVHGCSVQLTELEAILKKKIDSNQ